MKRFAILLLACLFAAPSMTAAAEHPEHPKAHRKAKPKKKKAPKQKWVQDKATMDAFVEAVEEYISSKEEEEGAFKVRDGELGKTWDLSLLRIHKDRIARLGEDKFFACADFEESGGKAKKTLDLDFFVTRGEDGTFAVDEIPVHKVEGKPRYTYNDANERVPVPGAKKKPAGKSKKKEHPEHPTGGGHEHPEHPN